MVKTINVAELHGLLENGKAILVDVREVAEYNIAHIDGSILIPLSELTSNKIPDKSQVIVMQCASGKRSEVACIKLLIENPGLEIYNLEGGINAWKQAGLPVLSS